LGKPVQVTEEERLVTRPLPDNPDFEFPREMLGLFSPLVIGVDLIGVQ
jgi:hypothetical protein